MKTRCGLSFVTLFPLQKRGALRWHLCVPALALALIGNPAANAADSGRAATAEPPPRSASLLGGALPGGAVISAAVSIVAVSGGEVKTVPLAADGSFRFAGLAPGRYRLALVSPTAAKQTQGATFGEKVNAGLQAAGGAVAQGGTVVQGGAGAQGATEAPSAKIGDLSSGMPNRISMNVTTARQNLQLVVDGDPVEVDVASDGLLSGSASVAK
jgi:hypothetical protein